MGYFYFSRQPQRRRAVDGKGGAAQAAWVRRHFLVVAQRNQTRPNQQKKKTENLVAFSKRKEEFMLRLVFMLSLDCVFQPHLLKALKRKKTQSNMSGQPIDIHYGKMKEWLEDRASLFGKKHTKELQLCLSIAPQLVQAVRYDIPAIKKTIGRLNNQRTETLASVEDAPRAEQQQRSLQRQLLASYGISASDLERGATTLESLLEDRICEVERSVTLFLATEVPSTLPKCIEVYEKQLAQVRFVSTVGSSSLFAQHFPWLSRALEESDVLASSAKQSHAAQASHSNEAAADAPEPTIDIDWGDDDDVVGATTTGTAAADGGPHVEINWGDEDTEEQGELNGAPTTSAPPEDIGAPPLRTTTGAPSVMVARADHRAALVHELSALEMFLDEHVLDTLQRDGIADTAEQRVKHCPSLTTYIQQVSGIVKRLTVGNEANLLRMRNNFRLKEKWMNSVEDTDRVVARIRARAATADQRVAAMSDEIAKLTPQVEELIATSKTQQKACEEALQRVFPDREVLIVGDINAL